MVLRPASGSVTAKQPFDLALDDVGQDALLLLLGAEHHDRVGPEDVEVDRRGALQAAPDSATVCIISAASVMPSPAPPYSSGMAMPSQPASAIAR